MKREKYEKIYDYQNNHGCFDEISIHYKCIEYVKFFSRISDDFHKKNERSTLIRCTLMQQTTPREAGSRAANTVHFQLPVSFLMVQSVVEHGQCISEKSMVHRAVVAVHPLAVKRAFISMKFPVSAMLPSAR